VSGYQHIAHLSRNEENSNHQISQERKFIIGNNKVKNYFTIEKRPKIIIDF
jgi:hypothetical protein